MPGHYDQVFSMFNEDLFRALKPPLLSLKVDRFDGSSPGSEVHLKVGLPPFLSQWVSVITEEQKREGENYFVDEGRVLPWPLKYWRHTHRVVKVNEKECDIIDDIEYSCGSSFLTSLMYAPLKFQFSLRSPQYQKFFLPLKGTSEV